MISGEETIAQQVAALKVNDHYHSDYNMIIERHNIYVRELGVAAAAAIGLVVLVIYSYPLIIC